MNDVSISAIQFWGPKEGTNGGIDIHWAGPQGFGVVSVMLDENHNLQFDHEFMGREFIAKVFVALLECEGEHMRLYWTDGKTTMVEDADGNLIPWEGDDDSCE